MTRPSENSRARQPPVDDKKIKKNRPRGHDLSEQKPCAVVASLGIPGSESEISLNELVLLLRNLDVPTAGRIEQKKDRPDPAYFIGSGKAMEAKDFALAVGANLLVVDDSLSPTQRSNLKKATGLEVWDRPFVIMKIFESRARTAEAKLQVELALLKYEIPSLKGLGMQMSRLGGGIGTRGPGETEFERHRRKLELRIKYIEKNLESVRLRRKLLRDRKKKDNVPVVALVGYTNSGKSTLLSALSGDGGIYSADQLFSTLDTVTRKIDDRSGHGRPFLLSDTVGFIRRLPADLIAAFRATLEEIADADLLLFVLDSSDPELFSQYETVEKTLKEIGSESVPRLVLLNKTDKLPENVIFFNPASSFSSVSSDDIVRISALSGEGLSKLRSIIYNKLQYFNI